MSKNSFKEIPRELQRASSISTEGFSIEPKVKIISDKIAKAGLAATDGGEVKATSVRRLPTVQEILSCLMNRERYTRMWLYL